MSDIQEESTGRENLEMTSDATSPALTAVYAKHLFRRLGPLGPLAVVASSLPFIGAVTTLGLMAWMAPWLRQHGDRGIAVYVIAFTVLGGLALLPTFAQSVMAGFAFGNVSGSLAALAGIFGASMIGYAIARRASGNRVVTIIAEQPKWRAVYDALIGGSFLKTLAIVTLVRVPNSSPFAMTNLVLAATRVNPLVYALGTMIGIAPRTIVAVMIGAGLSTWDLSQAKHKWLFAAGIIVTMVVLGIIGAIANQAVQKVTRAQSTTPPAQC